MSTSNQLPDDYSSIYHSAKGGSSAFAILFTFSFGLHIWQSRKYNSWPFTWQLPFACILIIAGFICREVTAFHPHDDELSAVQGLFYVAALLFTLPLYSFLMRLLSIPPTVVRIYPSYFFCVLSCFTTAIITCISQGAATYFSPSQSHDARTSGLALVKAALILQLFLNGLFIYFLALFQYRQKQRYQSEHSRDQRMMIVITTSYVLIGLIIIRTIFRTVQIFAKPLSPLWTDEAYFWAFEAVIMLMYTTIFHVLHPAKYLSMGTGTCKNTKRSNGVEEGDLREM